MNEFKTTLLNEKYSIPVHKNRADLMAELNNINIMGDESDVEPPGKKDNEHTANGLSAVNNVGGANKSKLNGGPSSHMSTDSSSDASDNGVTNGDESMLRWAQNRPDSLSVHVASLLSDHDYLSHDNLICIITSNEESFELEKQSQKQREIVDNVIPNSTLPKNSTTDSQRTVIYDCDAAEQANATLNNETRPPTDGIDNLNDILQKLRNTNKSDEKSALLDQILETVQKIKLEEVANTESVAVKVENVKDEVDSKQKCPAQNNPSHNASDFSSNHSEPTEYYGAGKFSTQSSTEEAKENKGEFCFEFMRVISFIFEIIHAIYFTFADVDLVQMVQNDLKFVEDIALRISIDTKLIRGQMIEIQKKSEQEQIHAVRDMSENFGLLVADIANELSKTAIKLNPKTAPDTKAINQQNSPIKRAKKWSHSSSSTDDEDTGSDKSSSHRKQSRKMKRRRKVATSRASAPGTSSNSEKDLPHRNIKEEPLVISQDVHDLMNGGGASNSANESLSKENDLLGFDQLNNAEMHKELDEMLNSSKASLSPVAVKSPHKSPIHSNTAGNSMPTESSDKVVDGTKNSSLLEPGSTPTISEDLIDKVDNDDDACDNDDEDDDEEIQKYDFFSNNNIELSTN